MIEDAQPGCSFVLPLDGRGKVRDFRLYVVKDCRGLGYGFMAASFIKAYLFPWTSNTHAPGRFSLPLGGCWGANSVSLLPVTAESMRFYRRNGFEREATGQTFIYEPALDTTRLTQAERDRAFGLPAATPTASPS